MNAILIGVVVLTLATIVLALLWRGVLWLRGKPAQHYMRRMLLAHVLIVPVHALLVLPGAFGYLGSRQIGTRGDERAYRGPDIREDGTWVFQERGATGEVDGSKFRVVVPGHDGVQLQGYLVPPASGDVAFRALLVHGLFRNALELERIGSWLRDMGGEVLLLEQRNHGGSDRRPATYGLEESKDLVEAARWLHDRGAEPMIAFGVSLGAATVALAAPRMEGLSGLVLDAPMEDLWTTGHRMFGSRGMVEPFRSLAFRGVELWSGFRMADVRPADVLPDLPAEIQVMFIGGGEDKWMPPHLVERMFDTLPQPEGRRTLWIHPDAEHGRVWDADPEGYRKRLQAFVERVLAAQ